MGLFNFLNKEIKTAYYPGVTSLDGLFSGTNASESNVLGLSAYWQGISTISNAIGSLPFKVYKDKTVDKANPIHFIIKEKPNQFQTSFEFFSTAIMVMLIKGNAFAHIRRDGKGDVIALELIESNRSVEAKIYNGQLYFKFGCIGEAIHNNDLLHFKGLGAGYLGIDPIENFKRNFEISLNSESYSNKVYTGEASSLKGYIEYSGELNDNQRKQLRSQLSKNFSGANGKSILFLEDGMKFHNINLSPEQTQFLQSREFQLKEIARILNVPPFVVGDYNQAYSNIEQQNLHFYKQTILPILTKLEAELKHKLFSKSEILDGYYVKASPEGFLRGDSQSRAAFYKELFYLGSISPEEIRALEDMPEDVNGETYIQANLIPKATVNRFWDSKAKLDYSKADLNEDELNNDQE